MSDVGKSAVQVLGWTRRVALQGLAPAAATVAQVLFLHFVLVWLHNSAARFHPWVVVLLLPPVALEVAFTRWFEARRYGWHLTVVLGLAARLAFIAVCYYVLVWHYLQHKYDADVVVAGLVDWPLVLRMFWQASPLLGVILAIPLVALYYVLTCRLRLFRLTTVVVLPVLATVALFQVLYFHPGSGWRGLPRHRPADVEQVFPPPGAHGIERLTTPLYARSVYVSADDRWIALSSGATFGDDPLRQQRPNFLWMDLQTRRTAQVRVPPVRWFASTCDERLYFAPWHGHNLYAFDPRTQQFSVHPLPQKVGGRRVKEINTAYHDCARGRVYVGNALPPALFVWDTKSQRVVETVDLSRLKGVRPAVSPARIQRSPRDGRLVIPLHGIYQVLELDDPPVVPRRVTRLPTMAMDLAFTPDGAHIFAPAFFHGAIWKLRADTLAVVGHLPAPPQCRQVLVSEDGALLFAASYLYGRLHVYDIARNREAFSIFVSPKIEGLYQTKRYLYIYGADGVFRIRHEDLRRRM